MSVNTRNRKRWTIDECIRLQREFELLELSIDEIALKHQRTPNAIMFKLDKEGFADYNTLYTEYYNLDFNKQITEKNFKEDDNDDDEEDKDKDKDHCKEYDYDDLKTHIISLEKQISTLTKLFMKQNKNNKTVLSLFE